MELPTVASGQHFIVGFGADPQVRTRRELLNKSDEVQGGNRVLRFEYRLVLANFHKSPVRVQLYDRLPYQGTTNEINCVLGESKFKISDDTLYQRLQKPKGMLRWDLEVPAGAARDTAFDVDYQLTITFDRSKTITGLTQVQQQAFDLQDRSPSGKGSGMGMGGMVVVVWEVWVVECLGGHRNSELIEGHTNSRLKFHWKGLRFPVSCTIDPVTLSDESIEIAQSHYQRSKPAPQVSPAPNPQRSTGLRE